MYEYSEQKLVEDPAIELFEQLGYETANCFQERVGEDSTLGRQTTQEVVLVTKLRAALRRLNPDLTEDAFDLAIQELTRDRSALHPAVANQEVHRLLKDGVKVTLSDDNDEEHTETVRIIDWNNPDSNDFFLASQLWISGEIYKRRADLIGFVNGLPIVLVELKAVHRNLKNAYDDNLKDYKATIPQLFWYNAFIILSNGSDSRVGTVSAPWEHFSEWKKISSEEEPGVVSLETVIRGTCEKGRLIDLIENFILFSDVGGALVKIVSKYHQFLGVNSAIKAMRSIKENQGRLGVFWHTQGSGKSYSMIFFAQKVMRKISGNWTFVVVTDRDDLGDQIYKNFAGAGVVTEKNAQATSSRHLRRLLTEDHRYVFTLIQKFRAPSGKLHPKLSDRSDIIVMTDEAHRSQYDILAKNMRDALPNAAFIGFTGTPLIAGEERTKEVFGDYVSVYNFRQSWEDRSTVPLYYENRIPELQLTNENLNEEMEQLLEEAELDEDQQRKLEREFSRQYHLITRDERLEKIAKDLVDHFMGRGYHGKAMVVSIDKATAVRMYDKVQKFWKLYLERLKSRLAASEDELERAELQENIRYMETTDMAVVVSQGQNEAAEMREKGLDILPHRRRKISDDLDTKFKDPDDPFQIVFVCAMWMTGFDVPSCSTIYIDKPMRNHTLMQTIARANRVFGDKVNGLIVDYVGVFRNLQRALAIYGTGSGGRIQQGDTPVLDKAKLVEALEVAVERTESFCLEHNVRLADIQEADGFQRIKLFDDAVEFLIVNDESKRQYLSLASDVARLFQAILPDAKANVFVGKRAVITVIAAKIKSLTPEPDISGVVQDVEELLDRSVAAEGYVIRDPNQGDEERFVDLSRINFSALEKTFQRGRKKTEAEKLRALVDRTLERMVLMNRSRLDFQERFQALIDEYNAGSINVLTFFNRLLEFAKELNEEEKRGISENLTEEELAIFDLLTKPEMTLTKRERDQVKKAASDLLTMLKAKKLVLDWRKRQQSRAQVMVTIEEVLDKDLPDKFAQDVFQQKCELVYQHVYDSYFGDGRSVYAGVI